MGLLSNIFGGSTRQAAADVSFLQTYSGGSGGWGLSRFNSIVDAHSSVEDMVDVFNLDQPDNGYSDCYEQAYEEAYEKASEEVDALMAVLVELDGAPMITPEDLINEEEVAERAHQLAIRFAESWLSGETWIPEEVMDWAWYDLSDHNY